MNIVVEEYDRKSTVSDTELQLLRRFSGVGYVLFLTGHDLPRARRLMAAPFGFLSQGRLGDRYFALTEDGDRFLANVGRAKRSAP
jgi:hypothetical protein